MAQVLPLSTTACLVTVQGLLGIAENTSPALQCHLMWQLRTDSYTAVSHAVLLRILHDHPQKLTNDMLAALTPPHLQDLNLKNCSNISAYGIHRLLKRCKHLQKLGLGGCEQFMVPNFFQLVGRLGVQLRFLNLSRTEGVNSNLVQVLLKNLPNLYHLDISGCREVQDSAFLVYEDFQEGIAVHGHSSLCRNRDYPCHLGSVELEGCRVTRDAVYHLTTLCGPHLKALNITNTKVDCFALWLLCGFSLCTVARLASKLNVLENLCSPQYVGISMVQDLLSSMSFDSEPLQIGEQAESTNNQEPGSGDQCLNNIQVPTRRRPKLDKLVNVSCLEHKCFCCCNLKSGRHTTRCSGCMSASSAEGHSMDSSLTNSSETVCSFLESPCSGCMSTSSAEGHSMDSSLTNNSETFCSFLESPCSGCMSTSSAEGHSMDSSLTNSSETFCSLESPCSIPHSKISCTCRKPANDSLSEGYLSDDICDNYGLSCQTSGGNCTQSPCLTNSPCPCCSHTRQCSFKFDDVVQLYQPNLHSLEMLGLEFHSLPMGQECLKDLVRYNPQLTKLHIYWRGLADETLDFIAKNAPNLRNVALVECVQLTSSGLNSLASNCTHLEHLDLEGVAFISDSDVIPLLKSLRLKSLSLLATKITDETLKIIASKCNHQLESLDLSWCEDATVEGLNAVTHSCSALCKLSLKHAPVEEETLLKLSENCTGLKNLKVCDLEAAVTDFVLCSWSVRLKQLTKLDLGWDTDLTDVGISAIVVNLVHLEHLTLAGLFRITSAPFMPIITGLKKWRRCQGLLRLKMWEQGKLDSSDGGSSDEEYEDLCLPHRSTCYAPNLQFLDLVCCHQVNEYHIAEIVAVCRGTLTATNTDVNGEPLLPNWIRCQNGRIFETNPNEFYAEPDDD